MFGVRCFHLLSVALCFCMLHWAQAHAADAVVHVKQAAQKHKPAAPPQKHKPAASSQKHKPTALSQKPPPATSQKHKSAAASSAKSKKRAPLPPASAELPQSGVASWVGKFFEGKPVANAGERHIRESFTAAHRALPFNTILKVTDLNNGRSILVRVNDRGPYVRGRIIDLSKATADYLRFFDRGLTTVRLELAGNDADPAQRYYIRMRPSKGSGKAGLVRGFGPFGKFDEAASLFMKLYETYPEAELLAVREAS